MNKCFFVAVVFSFNVLMADPSPIYIPDMQWNQVVKNEDEKTFFQPFTSIVNKEGCSVQLPLCSVALSDSSTNMMINFGATPSGIYSLGVQPVDLKIAGIPISMSEFSITEFFTKLLPLIEAQGVQMYGHEIKADLEIPKLHVTGKNKQNGAKVFIECHVSNENIYQLSVMATEDNPKERKKIL